MSDSHVSAERAPQRTSAAVDTVRSHAAGTTADTDMHRTGAPEHPGAIAATIGRERPSRVRRVEARPPDGSDAPTTQVTQLGAAASRIRLSGSSGPVGSVDASSLDSGAMHLSNLEVDGANRGQGFGAHLLGAAAQLAERSGDKVITLGSGDSGTGHLNSWYHSLGFRQQGQTPEGAPALDIPTGQLRSNTTAATRIRRSARTEAAVIARSPAGRIIRRMELPEPVVPEGPTDTETSMIDTLLGARAANYIMLETSELKRHKDVPADLKGGVNLQIGTVRKSLKAVLERGDKLSRYVMTTMLKGKLTQPELFAVMEQHHKFGTNRAIAEKRLVSSSLLADRGDPPTSAAALSAENLKRMTGDIQQLREATVLETNGDAFTTILKKFMGLVQQAYTAPTLAHASKSDIKGSINSTANRQRLETFSQDAVGSHESQKLTNTSPTNTSSYDSHELVYLNVYPELRDPSHRKEVLGSTRFLNENYALENSARSTSAHSYLFDQKSVQGGDRLSVATLRDPVHPSGGLDDKERQKRVGNNPYTKFSSAKEGGYAYKVGDGDREKQFDYQTRENFFAGADITPGLVANVERGLLRIFLCSQAANRKNLYGELIRTLKADATNGDQDRMLLAIIKYFQYPQMMVSGSLPLESAKDTIKY